MNDNSQIRERGATLVEAALVIPLFLFLLFGMIDFGYGIFQDSQATAGARDGARYGILDPTDTAGIEAEAKARAVGQDAVVEVACLDGPTGTTTVPCASAVPGEDRIEVVVSWDYVAPTGVGTMFGSGRTISGSSTMLIVGRPLDVTDPTPDPDPPTEPPDDGDDPDDGPPLAILTDCTGEGDGKQCEFSVGNGSPGETYIWWSSVNNTQVEAAGYLVTAPGNNVEFTVFLRVDPAGTELSVDVTCSNGNKGTCSVPEET